MITSFRVLILPLIMKGLGIANSDAIVERRRRALIVAIGRGASRCVADHLRGRGRARITVHYSTRHNRQHVEDRRVLRASIGDLGVACRPCVSAACRTVDGLRRRRGRVRTRQVLWWRLQRARVRGLSDGRRHDGQRRYRRVGLCCAGAATRGQAQRLRRYAFVRCLNSNRAPGRWRGDAWSRSHRRIRLRSVSGATGRGRRGMRRRVTS